MSDALEEHDGKVSKGGRNVINLPFADDIAALEALGENRDTPAQGIRWRSVLSSLD